MLRNLAVCIKTENVERHLLACACKIVNRLKEHLVSILKRTDVIYCGLYRRGCRICYTAYESLCSYSLVVGKFY